MDAKKFAAAVATTGMLGLGGLGVGMGISSADPHKPAPDPSGPGNSQNSGNQGNQGNGNPGPRPTTVTGPGVNAGDPGNPLPPGLGYLPPPGHGGPMPQDRTTFDVIPDWVTNPATLPSDAPPMPGPGDLPDWATGMQVVWNPDLGVWGVWDPNTNSFIVV
jgi:hypothetical protein